MGVTIKDIAQKTGVSITSVSLVLNKKENRISAKTKQLIEAAAQELNYSPNQSAFSLATKKTNTIGLIIPGGTFYPFADMARAFETACKNAGFGMILLLPEGDGESCIEAVQTMTRKGTDAVVFDSSVLDDTCFDQWRRAAEISDVPFFSIADSRDADKRSVIVDHRQGGYLAASHLLELGHKNIGCVLGHPGFRVTADFLLGIEDALAEFDVDAHGSPALLLSNTAESGYEGLSSLIEKNITAVIAGSDRIAAGVLRRAYELKLAVPEQLSVTGYGNSVFAANLHVPLTSVSAHFDRIARKIVYCIKNPGNVQPQTVQPSLIARESTARPAVSQL
jgi:LacI family transcriptional regulator